MTPAIRQAIATYTRVMELAPDDWRPHTYRGIRRASVLEFEGAVTDLERGRELAPLNYDVSYYLGLAEPVPADWNTHNAGIRSKI